MGAIFRSIGGTISACLLLLHSPDGAKFRVSSDGLAIRPAEKHQDHLAKGTKAIVYSYGRPHGVRESAEKIASMIEACEGKQP